MNLTELHRRLLADVLAVGDVYPLVLTGGYAIQAHGLVNRLSKDLDVATENPEPMEEIAAAVRAGLEQRGWQVRGLETDPLFARLIVTDTATCEECEVDVLKEALWRPPVRTQHGLVMSLEDVVGTKVRALADRGLARDLIDVRAAADRWSRIDLEGLGRRHAHDSFDLSDLQARLAGADWIDDTEFAAYGIDDHQTIELRQWAQEWADDIAERLQEAEYPSAD
ncbi:nucleotidyl transferase AbiEii/AbiGii toxin family protein [Streptomyces sp. NPDC051909]|uniref:nucleotidyl transferase AbiEii/AbiGii toxin family protein n=1 Tax=Streptomyces sp. NPDC051909 TaxID=3154944 RepID=UPI0034440C50